MKATTLNRIKEMADEMNSAYEDELTALRDAGWDVSGGLIVDAEEGLIGIETSEDMETDPLHTDALIHRITGCPVKQVKKSSDTGEYLVVLQGDF